MMRTRFQSASGEWTTGERRGERLTRGGAQQIAAFPGGILDMQDDIADRQPVERRTTLVSFRFQSLIAPIPSNGR